jgi:hypothetical protein
MLGKYIIVKTSFIGFHRYPTAPAAVSFLRDKHRHIFNVEVTLRVQHNDRELEFFLVQAELDKCIDFTIDKQDTGSCENVAEDLFYAMTRIYGEECIAIVMVDEDGENGGSIVNG